MTHKELHKVLKARIEGIDKGKNRRHYYLNDGRNSEQVMRDCYAELLVLMYKEDRDSDYYYSKSADKDQPLYK